jgi:exopolysaccharide biosynthesis polyprenyl glycosylphosphotransferase
MLSKLSYQQIWKTSLLPVVDFFSILGGIAVVYLIRYSWFKDAFFGDRKISTYEYIFSAVVISLVVVLTYAFFGLYQVYQKNLFWQTLFKLTAGIALVILALITYFFFYEYNREVLPQGVPISRFIIAAGSFAALYFVLLGRLLFWVVEQILYQFGLGKISVAILGDNDNFLRKQFIKTNYIKDIFEFNDLNDESFKILKDYIQAGKLSEVYLQNNTSTSLGGELALICERYKVNFIFSPQGFTQFEAFGLKPVIIRKKLFLEVIHSNLDGWQVVIKRLFDIVFALTFIISLSWLYLIIAIAIKLDSKGPVFYLSQRVGPNGKMFKIFKFRRLKEEFCTDEQNPESLEIEKKLIQENNTRKDDVLYKISDDPRSTRVGRFIEKYSLDEMPQFFNVLIGNMSVVGPRPHQPREVAKYSKKHYKVLNISPGITGFGQINGRSDLVFEQEVKYDTYYIEHWSFFLDLWIIIKTPFIILFRPHKS